MTTSFCGENDEYSWWSCEDISDDENDEKSLKNDDNDNDDEYLYDDDFSQSENWVLMPNQNDCEVFISEEQLLIEVLCSNRVSQMTKTYNDIEAVTRLLHEKEKDIELTARIGKDLLAYNSRIESDNTELRNELKIRNEQISQLQHELHCKTELIRALTSDVDSSEATTPCDEGLKKLPGSNSITVQDLELLQRKVKGLEDENKHLKGDYEKLVLLEDECQSKEQSLMSDITNRLIMAESDCIAIHDELERQREENKQQHEEILALRGALNEAQLRLARLTEDHENQNRILEVTKETQGELAGELLDYKQRYEEVVALLREAQEQARIKRKKAQPSVRPGLLPWSNLAGTGESLQSELEGSIHSDSSYDSGISPASDRLGAYSSFGSTPMGPSTNPQYKRVFDTVRCASRASSGLGSSLSGSNLTTSSRPYSCVSSIYMDSTGHNTDDSSGEWENYPAKEKPGIPGVPGAADLEAALKRLTPAEIYDRRAQLQMHPWQMQSSTNFYDSQAGFRTPDSIMSIGSSSIYSSNYSGNSSNSWKLPGSDKLQIVKPLEGSQTLQQWAHLATPTLGGLLDERPGVKIRGGKELQDIGLESYALEDLEEDEEPLREPCKQFVSTSTIYTYTTSKIMHVEDGPGSLLSRPGSLLSSRAPSPPPQDSSSDILVSKPGTPCRSRRNSTSTFSTNSGLAQMLNERGIQAVTPSCVGTPLLGYTPTTTPCNSPERPSSPTKDALGSPLRRGTNLTKSERKLLAGIKIREKIERIGLDNILPETGKTGFELQAGLPTAGLYSKRCSPMAQLTSLKTSCGHQNPGPSNPTLPSTDPPILTSKPPISKSKKVLKRSDSSSSTQDIGVPQKPGSGALNRRLEQLGRKGVNSSRRGSRAGAQHRPDLGQVGPQNGTNTKNNEKDKEKTGALGTISFLIFGRKGGLL